ncbi:MAG TPA: helix-turn-helix transcriptional regulator [Chroococcales cyanobacterium]|jgi:DNA-binding transcriptional regulator YiaG
MWVYILLIEMLLKPKQRWMRQPALGRLVRELRCTMQLSQEKFADEFGMTFATINRWENGHTMPSPLALKQIDTLLNHLGERGEALRTKYAPKATQGKRYER